MQTRLVKLGRLFLSILFIFSGVSKLISLPFFDGLVAELLIGKDYYDYPDALFYTQVLTRVIIASELLLGAAVLQEVLFKKLVLPIIQGMLLLFTVHLFYEGFRHENGFIDGNCGCFGDVLPMNNLESIIKNVVAMLFGMYVWQKHKEHGLYHFKSWVMPTVLGIVTLVTLWLTIKDYSSPEPVSEEPYAFVKPKPKEVEVEGIKLTLDSLIQNNEFVKALEVAKGDSVLVKTEEAYIKRLEEVVEIQKLN